VFSAEGVAVVTSLAAWMRGLGAIYYVGLALVTIGACAAVGMSGAAGFGVVIGLLIGACGIGAMAMWLRAAAGDFERGVVSDDEGPLGQGFRSLRAYLILSGILSALTLGAQILGEVL
jgi:hypothetical protein